VRKILAIAGVTVRDALRQKLAVNLAVFALLVIAGSMVLSQLTFGEQWRIIADLALSAAGAFGTLIAVFLGAGSVAGDIQRRSLYPIIAKPVSRTAYLAGRYLGLLAVLLLNLLVMAATTVAVLAAYRGHLRFLTETPLLLAFGGLAAQLAVVAAISLFFSTMANTTVSAIAGLAMATAGHFTREALPTWRTSELGRALAYLVPNLSALDFKVQVVYAQPVPAAGAALAFAYAALYVGVVLALASALFARRDFK
jgi:ABC-type transport system involved in multi-copper enzyme maturation permease subunit